MTAAVTRRPRPAARILLEDASGAILLFRFTPDDRPPLWATPGGACDPGEDFISAAARELFEETGLRLDPGPILFKRSNDFTTFEGVAVTADEAWFHVRVSSRRIDTRGHTDQEAKLMQSHRWFTRAELADWPEPIFPKNIIGILAEWSPA